MAPQQDGEKPNRDISGEKIGTDRPAVALNDDVLPVQGVADEIADRVMDVKRQDQAPTMAKQRATLMERP